MEEPEGGGSNCREGAWELGGRLGLDGRNMEQVFWGEGLLGGWGVSSMQTPFLTLSPCVPEPLLPFIPWLYHLTNSCVPYSFFPSSPSGPAGKTLRKAASATFLSATVGSCFGLWANCPLLGPHPPPVGEKCNCSMIPITASLLLLILCLQSSAEFPQE